jgi:hypothetical protein
MSPLMNALGATMDMATSVVRMGGAKLKIHLESK